MDNQLDHRRTLTPGHESHGVHVCNKCGWHYPNPHPSAKHRRAHKKICGTIEGYKLEGQQTHFNGSDDEHLSDDDKKGPGPNNLETDQSDKGNFGIGAKLVSLRSEDEVFSDAVADFADSGLSSGIKEPLQQEGSGSGTSVEIVQIKDPEFSKSSEKSDFIDDASQVIVESSDDYQIQNPKTSQIERVEVGNKPELHGQLSSSIVDPLPSSIAGLRTEESSVVHRDDFFSLSGDSHPSKTEVSPDVFPENVYAGENVTDYSLISAAKENNLIAKDEVKSAIDVVETVDSSDNVVSETCEGVSDTAVNSAISLDHQVLDEAVNPNEKNGAEFLSVLDQDDLALELNSAEIRNASKDVQAESAHEIQFATSSHVNISLENAEGIVNVDFAPTHDERPDVADSRSEFDDFKDPEGGISQDPLRLHSSESLKHDDDLKNGVTEENSFVFYPGQLPKTSDILSPDVHVVSSTNSMKELDKCESIAKETHAQGNTEVSPVKITVESFDRSHESDGSMSAMETEMNESHVIHLSEEPETVGVSKDLDQISLLEGSLMTSLNENPREASFGSVTSETSGVISTDNVTHHEKNSTEINDVAVDGDVVRANVENGIGAETKDLQPGDLQLEAKQSGDSFKSDDAGEMGKIENYDITESPVISEAVVDDATRKAKGIEFTNIGPISDAQEYIKEDEINNNIKLPEDRSDDLSAASYHVQTAENLAGKYAFSLNTEPSALHAVKDNQDGDAGCEVSGIATVPVQDIKENKIITDIKEHGGYNRSFDSSADSHHAQDAELLVKAAENICGKHTSLSSLNTKSSVHRDYAVEDNGEASGKASGITAVPVQDQSVNNLVKHNSSGIDASVDSGSRCDSLEGNWGSVSVISLQSDAPAETLPSTASVASTEAGKSNMNNPKDASHRQQFEKSEMFEPPSFMTWVEPGHVVSPKAADSEVQKGPNSTLQAGWFPTLTQVTNESPGRKKNEEIIAKVTNWSTSKEHTPLKSLLGEAAQSNKPRSPRLEGNPVVQKNSKISENSISGLKTVNSILGPESPAAQAEKGEAAKEWNSPARYPADIKRDKGKVKSRPFWIQFVCCSSVDHQRR